MGVYLGPLYQEVEYIESSGTQYIDTGKTVDGNTSATYTYMPRETVTSSVGAGYLVCMDNGWKVNAFGSGNVYIYYGNNTSSGAGVTITTLAKDTMFTDVCSKSGCSRNGGTVWTPSASTSPTGTLKLFVSQRAGSIINYWKTRMYSFKRYDGGVLTQDLVPCYRKSDNVIGVFDKVENKFYTNAGSGTFIKGNDVRVLQPELKNAYIGEVGEYTISNIPTTDTNVYVNVARSGKTIQSVKFKFTATYISSKACYVLISSNNSNTNRYGLSFGVNTSGSLASVISIRGRLGGSDTYYRQIASSISGAYNIEYMISRDGNCVVKYNGNTTNYTATGTELTVIQTIMNLSNMNVYSADYGGLISGNKVNVEVTYS